MQSPDRVQTGGPGQDQKLPSPPQELCHATDIHCLASLQLLRWTREGGQDGLVTEVRVHGSDPGCKMLHDITCFNVTKGTDTWSSCFASGSMYWQEDF